MTQASTALMAGSSPCDCQHWEEQLFQTTLQCSATNMPQDMLQQMIILIHRSHDLQCIHA